jgi:ketosteroid isomerase-like protein
MMADEILSIHTDSFNRALKERNYAALEGLYASDYMLVRPDGSVLNKQEVLQDLRSGGLRFDSIELGQTEVRMYGSTAVLTAESQAVSSRDGMESRSHFRLIAVYVQQGQSIKLVHFQPVCRLTEARRATPSPGTNQTWIEGDWLLGCFCFARTD